MDVLAAIVQIIERNLLTAIAYVALIALFVIVMYRRLSRQRDRKIDEYLSRRAPAAATRADERPAPGSPPRGGRP